MTYLNKYFFMLITPLLLSYLIPLIFFKNSTIIYYPIDYSIILDNYTIETYPFSTTFTVITLIISWVLFTFFITNIFYKLILKIPLTKYFNKNSIIDLKKLYYIFIYLSIFGNLICLAHNFIIFNNSIEQIIHQFSLIPILTVGIGAFILNNNKLLLNKKNLFIIYLLIFINVINSVFLFIITSRIAYALYMLLAFFYIFHYSYVNFKIKFFVASILIMIIPLLMTAKVYIRNNYYYDGKTRIELIHFYKVDQLFTTNAQPKRELDTEIKEFLAWDKGTINNSRLAIFEENGYLNYLVRRVTARVNHLNTTVYMYSIFPHQYSYLGFDYLKRILSGIIPRIFWADKPNNDSGNTLPVFIKLLPPSDTLTSFNLNIIEEGIAYQGILGVMIVGVIFSFLAAVFFSVATVLGNLYLILLPLSIFTLSNTEAGMYGIFNGSLRTLFVYFWMIFLINFLVQKREKFL